MRQCGFEKVILKRDDQGQHREDRRQRFRPKPRRHQRPDQRAQHDPRSPTLQDGEVDLAPWRDARAPIASS